MGRSGTPFAAAAAFALRCSAIFSFNALRAAPAPTDLEKEGTEAWDDAREEVFGLLGSFSKAVFSRFSSVSNILLLLLASPVTPCISELTPLLFAAIPVQTSNMCSGMTRGPSD
jgi:hypothetical protein